MAKDGKKLELYEVLAAKRAKGRHPLALETKPSRPPASAPPARPATTIPIRPPVIVDEAVQAAYEADLNKTPSPAAVNPSDAEPEGDSRYRFKDGWLRRRGEARLDNAAEPAPEPPARPRTPREVVFSLDAAIVFFMAILAMVGSSYFLGYKRGQEERPVGLAGEGIENADAERIPFHRLRPPPRSAVRPAGQDYTLVIRTEPAGGDMPERLEMELAEALARGRREAGADIPGFIFQTGGAEPRYILAVGLGKTAGDPDLDRLLKIYYKMDGIPLSREPAPYRGCRIALVGELGVPVF